MIILRSGKKASAVDLCFLDLSYKLQVLKRKEIHRRHEVPRKANAADLCFLNLSYKLQLLGRKDNKKRDT